MNENEIKDTRQVKPSWRFRATLTTATQLDETLCRIQEEGGIISSILICYGTIKGQEHNVGDGKYDVRMAMESIFAVTYREVLKGAA